jgi:hypothetical protein
MAATLVDLNYAWLLDQPKDKLANMLVAAVSGIELFVLLSFRSKCSMPTKKS